MSIIPADIVLRYTVAAAAGDTTPGTMATSLGDQVSTTPVPNDALGNYFPDVTGAESTAGVVKYRALCVLNTHATLTLTNAQVSITGQVSGGGTVAVAVDGTAASAKGSASSQVVTIVNENTPPAGASAFSAGPIALGSIAPSQVKGIWLRLTIPAGATSPGLDGVDEFDVVVEGDTLP